VVRYKKNGTSSQAGDHPAPRKALAVGRGRENRLKKKAIKLVFIRAYILVSREEKSIFGSEWKMFTLSQGALGRGVNCGNNTHL